MDRNSVALLLLAGVACAALVAVVAPRGAPAAPLVSPPASGGRTALPGQPLQVAKPGAALVIELYDYLPAGCVKDGSVDYTVQAQKALDAAAGKTLRLPPFPVLVSRQAGQNWCLLGKRPIVVEGSPGSVLLEKAGAVQILRFEGADDLRLRGFTLQGKGGNGMSLAHGLLQVNGGTRIEIADVHVQDSDADGIAVANASLVSLRNCTAERCSKSALYVNGSSDVIVSDNLVRQSGGHLAPNASVVGAGIQISSCKNALCSNNVIDQGTGIGIKCDALAAGAKPWGCSILGNRISGVSNPTNMDVSGGIRCDNANADKATQTLVSQNSIQGCGHYGIYIENHGGSLVSGNSIAETWAAGIVASNLQDVRVQGNLILNPDTGQSGAMAGIYLINQTGGASTADNLARNSALFAPSGSSAALIDASSGGGNSLEPRVRWGSGPPTSGSWSVGDRMHNRTPAPGGWLGWACTGAGSPGVWTPVGKL